MDKTNLELFKQALDDAVSSQFDELADSCDEEITFSERHKRAMKEIIYGKTSTDRASPPARKWLAAILIAASLLLASCGIAFRNEIRELLENSYGWVSVEPDGD